MTYLRSFLRRFSEACARANITVWPVTINFAQPPEQRPEPRIAQPLKLVRDLSTPENRAFWDGVKESAALVKDAPDWMKAGINLDPRVFETYRGRGDNK